MQEAAAFYRKISPDDVTTQGGPILCLDPDEGVRQNLDRLFSHNGFQVHTASNLGEALEIIVRHRPRVVFTEIEFDDIEAIPVLRALKRMGRDIVLIIYTSRPERRIGQNRRLDHIFEFIVKPASSNELIGHLKRALHFHEKKRSLHGLVEETRIRIHHQMEWLMWMERENIGERVHFSKTILDSIKHSITQGNGVGSLITMAEMLQIGKKPHEDGYIVPPAMIDGLVESAGTVRSWLDDLDTVARNLGKKYEVEIIEADQFKLLVHDSIENMERFRKIKNHTISIDPMEFDNPIRSNESVIRLSIKEMLTNAFKFSRPDSDVKFHFHRTGNSFSLLITNLTMPIADGRTGIPPQFERKIFEPFIRLSNIHDDRYQHEMYGMGTGLSIVQGAINQVGGKIYLYEANDPSTDNAEDTRVVAELIFPVEQEAAPAQETEQPA